MTSAHLALLLSTLIYGVFYVGIKILVTEIPPWETFCLRLLLAAPLFFVLEKLFLNTPIQSREDWFKIAGLGLLGITFVQVTIVAGLKFTSVFHTGFIVGMAPLTTLFFAVLLKQEKVTLSKLVGIAIAFAGLILLLAERSGQDALPANYLWGDLLVFLNIAAWSLYLVLSRPLLQRYPAFSLTSYAFVLAGLLTLPLMLLTLDNLPGAGLSTQGWLWMGFIVLFSTILTYFLNYYALARLMPSTVAVYVFLQPIFTAIFAHWVLHEVITSRMILDGAVILLGVAIATGGYRPITRWLLTRNAV